MATTPKLSRAVVFNIGAPKARFEAVDLGFTGHDHLPAHTLISLRNGGGKSSLINLLFSVFIPHANKMVGRNDRSATVSISDYILDDDTAHLALEFVAGQETFVIGMVGEWKRLHRSGKAEDLVRRFYGFRYAPQQLLEDPDNPTLKLDTLPILTKDRSSRNRLAAFQRELTARALPEQQLSWTGDQSEWAEVLHKRFALDPELLVLQSEMNSSESGMAVLLKRFADSPAFVEYLAARLVRPEELGAVNALMAAHAEDLRAKPEMELDQLFLRGIRPRLEEAVACATAREQTTTALRAATKAAKITSARFEVAVSARTEQAASLTTTANMLEGQAKASDTAERTATAEALAYRHAEASLRKDAADAAVESATTTLQEAAFQLEAARCVETVLGRDQLTRDIDRLQREQRQLEVAAEPDRRTAADAAATFAAALTAAAAREAAAARQADRAYLEFAEEIDGLRAKHQAARERLVEAGSRVQDLESRAERIEEGRRRLVAEGVLRGREAPGDAVARHEALLEECTSEAERSAERYAELLATRDDLSSSQDDARVRAHTAEQELAAAEQQHGSVLDRYARLTTNPEIRAVSDEPDTAELSVTGPVVASSLRQRLDELVEAASATRVDLDAARVELAALDAGEPVVPHHYVQQVERELTAAGIDCFTGMRYLLNNTSSAAERLAIIERNPAAVAGLVVGDLVALERARSVLADREVPGTLLVTTSSGLLADDSSSDAAFVMSVSRPVLDPEAAAARQEELASLVEKLETRSEREEATVSSVRNVLSRLQELLTDHSPESVVLLDERIEALREIDEAAQAQLARLGSELADLAPTISRTAQETSAVADRRSAAAALLLRAKDAASTEKDQDPEQLRLDAEHHRAAAAEAERAADTTTTQITSRTPRLKELSDQSAQARATQQRYELQAADVPSDAEARVDTAARDSRGLGDLEDAWRFAQEVFDRKITDQSLADRLELAQQQLSRAKERLVDTDPDVVARAVALSADAQVLDPRGLSRLIDERNQAHTAEVRGHETAHAAAELAGQRLANAKQASSGRLPSPPPSEVAAAESAAVMFEQTARQRRLDTEQQTTRAKEARERAKELHAEAKSLGREAENLRRIVEQHLTVVEAAEPSPVEIGDGFTGDLDAALEQANEVTEAITHAATAFQAADTALDAVAGEVRVICAQERYASLTSNLRNSLLRLENPLELGREAPRWLIGANGSAQALEYKLDSLERTEDELASALATQVESARNALRTCERISTLPDDVRLGPIAGKPFLKLSVRMPSGDELKGQIRLVLQEAVRDRLQPKGMTLLTFALRRCATQVRAELFQPDEHLTDERFEIGHEKFSGGQSLTSAIMLYCVIARARSTVFGRGRLGGPLILDNPLGDANLLTLVEMQRLMADLMGVQLIALSGHIDPDLLGQYGAHNRLANRSQRERDGSALVINTDDRGGIAAITGRMRAHLPLDGIAPPPEATDDRP